MAFEFDIINSILVAYNYLLSITKRYRQLKYVVCESCCRQQNAKFLLVDN